MSLEYSMPESFIGAVAGFEGVSDGHTAIHGPTGCKFYPASVSEEDYVRDGSGPQNRNPLIFGSKYFFGQPRVPCTYLDMETFVSGASERLSDMISQIEKLKPGMIAVINSPGASLIGEDLTSLKSDIPIVVMDHAGYSDTIENGYQEAVLNILSKIRPAASDRKQGVNLTGISITHLRWKDTVSDLTSLLAVCGITVRRVVGAGWSVKDIRESADAELNVAVYPEYADRIDSFYEREYGIPSYSCPEGAPIGFKALETWITGICRILDKDPSPALEEINEKRKRTAEVLLSMEARHSLPRGRTFSVQCGGSTAYAVTKFLYSYLGMIPTAVKCIGGTEWKRRIETFLEERRIPVSDDPEETMSDMIISSGPVCASAMERGKALECIAVEPPSPVMICIDDAPPVGLKGTVSLLESILDTVSRHHRFR